MNHKSKWWRLLFIAIVIPTVRSGDDFCPAGGCEGSPHKEEKATVLLIGSTGNGKSALGNFLLNPFDEELLYDYEKQYFKTSRDAQPHTNETKVIWKNVAYESFHPLKNLTVIDTPGLNDVQDRKNMIYLMKKLQDLEGIHTCIIVVKFDGKIHNQYKATLKYYFKLLPDLFKRNLIVVVTHYSQDAASIRRREKLKINEEVIKRDILDAVRTTCGLSADPILFMIDCLPAQEDNVSLSVRSKILDYVFNQEPTIPQFVVAKLPSQMQDDQKKYDKLLQEATERSRQMYSDNPTLQEELEVMENVITDLKADRKHWEMKKDEYDTEEFVDYDKGWHTVQDWDPFEPKVSDRYDLKTCPYMIQNVIKKGEDERWKGERNTSCTLSGKVEARKTFHGFRASVILQVYKRDKYEKEITDYRNKIEETKSRLNEIEMKRMNLIKTRKEKSEQVIEEARQKNKKYLEEYMTVDEAIEQLTEGYQECHRLKREDRKDLNGYFDEATKSVTEMESLCGDYLKLDHCNTLKRESNLDPYHLADIYLEQKPMACWIDIVEVFCELSKHALALKVAERHDVDKKQSVCLKA